MIAFEAYYPTPPQPTATCRRIAAEQAELTALLLPVEQRQRLRAMLADGEQRIDVTRYDQCPLGLCYGEDAVRNRQLPHLRLGALIHPWELALIRAQNAQWTTSGITYLDASRVTVAAFLGAADALP